MEQFHTNKEDEPVISIGLAHPEDAAGIIEVQREGWLSTYPNEEAGISYKDVRLRVEGVEGEKIPQKVERWKARIETMSDREAIYVAKEGDKVVGFVDPCLIEGQRRLGALYVLSSMRGKGVGSKLLKLALDWHGEDQDVYLHVAGYNQNAISFYEGFGFEKTDKVVVDDVAIAQRAVEMPQIEMVRLGEESKGE